MIELCYMRQENMVRIRLHSMTNHELREVLVGIWSRLDQSDRLDHINELVHYCHSDSRLSPVAQAIRDAEPGENAIDIDRMIRKEHD